MVIISKTRMSTLALAHGLILIGDIVETLADVMSGDLLTSAYGILSGLVG